VEERVLDFDPEAGQIQGYVRFGPARMSDADAAQISAPETPDAESYVQGYRIYLVDDAGVRLHEVAYTDVQLHSQTGYRCCDASLYRMRVNTTIPDGTGDLRFAVIPVTSAGIELWLGATTGAIVLGHTDAPRVRFFVLLNATNTQQLVEDAASITAADTAVARLMGLEREMVDVDFELQGNRLVEATFAMTVAGDRTVDGTVAEWEANSLANLQDVLNEAFLERSLWTLSVNVISMNTETTVTTTTYTTTSTTTTWTNATAAPPRATSGAPGKLRWPTALLCAVAIALGLSPSPLNWV